MKKKIFTMLLSLMIASSVLCSCGAPEKEVDNILTTAQETSMSETTTLPPETTPPPETTLQTESNFDKLINPLTGLPSTSVVQNSRPVAVMINNHLESLPQYGISRADIIYEIPVEGGITRFMAVYENYSTVPNVCSVRSCRYYFPLISKGLDAVYLHWGLDKSIAADTLKKYNIDHLDGGVVGSPLFGRDAQRKKSYALEHTAYLQGNNLESVLKQYKIRTELDDSHKNKTVFKFLDDGQAINSDKTATKTVLNFSNAYYSTFTYDETSGKYLKLHSGKPQIDAKSKEQLSFKNLIILRTEIKSLKPGSVLLDVALNSGSGWYISDGKRINIKWKRENDSTPIRIFNEDETELAINRGNSYIALIGNDKNVSIS